MAILQRLQHAIQPSSGRGAAKRASFDHALGIEKISTHESLEATVVVDSAGVAKVEAAQAVWSDRGKYVLWAGLGLMWLIFEIDNTTVYNYQAYATSEFEQISLLAALSTAGTIVSAVLKPPFAKTSDVIGRAETYCITVVLYIISYILTATSKQYNTYAGGYILYCVGQTGMQILNQIIVSDISTTRWRALAIAIVNIPFIVIPWLAAFIADSALITVGWRWGIGMFAIIMPLCSLFIIIPLFYFQRRARQRGIVLTEKITLYDFCSLIDLGGVFLLCGGFAMLLLPLSLASTTPERWSTPWIPAVMVVGGIFLIGLMPYEKFIAKHPVLPLRYFKNLSITIACAMGLIDAFAFSATHTYMYTWATVAKNYDARDATFLTYTAGCMQGLTALGVGAVLYLSRRYKWLLMAGTVIRVVGYGVMLRLRGSQNSTGEIFAVQIIQGFGSGFVQSIVLVAAQITVSHEELALLTSLVLLFIYLGNGIGSSVAGAIYTGTFEDRLRFHLGSGVSESVVQAAYNSISDVLPEWGTMQRTAINYAYSDVLRYMTYAAVAAAVPPLVLVLFLPNLRLNDSHNLSEEVTETGRQKT